MKKSDFKKMTYPDKLLLSPRYKDNDRPILFDHRKRKNRHTVDPIDSRKSDNNRIRRELLKRPADTWVLYPRIRTDNCNVFGSEKKKRKKKFNHL